jgi:hypothetical protein
MGGGIISCYWPGMGEGRYGCYEVSRDQKITGITYNIYRWVDVDASDVHLEYLNTTLNDVSGEYTSMLQGNDLTVTFYVVDTPTWATGDYGALTRDFPLSDSDCVVQIMIGESPGSGKTKPTLDIDFKQTVAHELYHCVQDRFGQKATGAKHQNANWWKEGTASFMGNWFYPDSSTRAEEDNIRLYDPTLSLYTDVENGQAATLFFQFMNNVQWQDPIQMNEWMIQQKFYEDMADQVTEMSSDSDLYPNFPGFATAFHDSSITFKDESPVTGLIEIVPTPFNVPDSDSFDYPMSVAPWTINVYQTTFTTSSTVEMTYSPIEPSDQQTILQYREESNNGWSTISPGDTVTLPIPSTNTCPPGGSTWTFILTSTGDPSKNTIIQDSNMHAKITFKLQAASQKRDDSINPCQPKQPTQPSNSTTLDQCLVGSWNLDIPSMQAFMSQQLSNLQSVTISNLQITGSSTFSVASDFSSVMTFNNLDISYDGISTAEGISFTTVIDINGSSQGPLVLGQGNSTFSWGQGATSQGDANTETTIPDLGASVPLDVSLDQQYGSTTNVQYTCKGNSLAMVGYVSGTFTWAYTWTKAS